MKKLLVVVDMQKDFVDGALGSAEAQSIVDNVVSKVEEAEKNDCDIIFTLDSHYDDDYMSTEEGKNFPVPHCICGTEGWAFVDQLKYLAFELIFKHIKKNYDIFPKETFGSNMLFTNLRFENTDTDYDEIELVGLCTDICVISNAIICKTAQPNAHIVVDASCCAGVTPHSHDVAIEAMKTLQIEIRNEGKEPWRE